MSGFPRSIGVSILSLAVVLFLYSTVFDLELHSPFNRSRITISRAGGLRLDRPSLVASAPAPAALDRPAFRTGRFTVELRLRAARADASGPARIVAYSKNPDTQNWILGQSGTALEIRHRGRRAVFAETFRSGSSQHLIVRLEDDRVTLHEAERPPRRAALTGTARSWDPDCRLSLGNEVTGGRPWVGELTELRLYQDPLAPTAVERLLRPDAAEPGLPRAAWRLVAGDSVFLEAPSGERIGLRTFRWPWTLKARQLVADSYWDRRGSLRDVAQNALLTLPIGFACALVLRRYPLRAGLLWVICAQLALSGCAEALQFFSARRSAEWMDVVVNLIGATAGFVVTRRHLTDGGA